MATPTQNAVSTIDVSIPSDILLASLVGGSKWGDSPLGSAVVMTYSFPYGSASFDNNYGSGDDASEWNAGWYGLAALQQAGFERALSIISNITRLTFVELEDTSSTVGEIRIAMSEEVDSENFGGWAYYPSATPEAGDIWLSPDAFYSDSVNEGSWQFNAILHELGHALGLKHTFEDTYVLPIELENQFYSMMSYTNTTSTDPVERENLAPSRYSDTPMTLDILSLQYLYGVNYSYNSGNTTYTYDDSGEYFETIWDGGGIDTIDYSSSATGAVIDLKEGSASTLGKPVEFFDVTTGLWTDVIEDRTVWIAFGAQIENALGGQGDDYILGNDLANELSGNGGEDYLSAKAGNDVLIFSRDELAISSIHRGSPGLAGTGETIDVSGKWLSLDTYDGGSGVDTLLGSFNYDVIFLDKGLPAPLLVSIEIINTFDGNDFVNLTSSLFTLGNVTVNAGEGHDVIWSNDGDDTLNGDDGNDEILGWNGNDVLNGGAGKDRLFGGMGSDVLNGNIGDDILDGGAGADTMIGGSSYDKYFVDNQSDVVIELNEFGVDTIYIFTDSIAGGSYILPDYVEEAVMSGSADFNLTGNSGVGNWLIGNDGVNVIIDDDGSDHIEGRGGNDSLYGGIHNDWLEGGDGNDYLSGGSGHDTLNSGTGLNILIGGAGNDVYILESDENTLIENLGEGLDTVTSYYDFTLDENFENLGFKGDNPTIGIGNSVDNYLSGNTADNQLYGLDGDDTLEGGGGYEGGIDTLVGGNGNDIYIVYSQNDVLIEFGGGGTDLVIANSDFILGQHFENLELYNTFFGGIYATGNDAENSIWGNVENNHIEGLDGNDMLDGRANDDYLWGGRGNDLLFGNHGDDYIDGGDGDDILDGGFNGNETLIGGRGNDTFYVDSLTDVLLEFSGAGIDTVISRIDFVLATEFENLQLYSGWPGIIAIGNNVNNSITGNSNNNHLEGLAGNDVLNGLAGNDTLLGGRGHDELLGGDGNDRHEGGHDSNFMAGGIGNDTYVVRRGDGNGTVRDGIEEDQVVELTNQGIDTVESHVYTYTLTANVENLLLAGEYALKGFGNELDNIMSGNDKANLLMGADGNDILSGGAGNDKLYGGAGNDLLSGGAGIDVQAGGVGQDTFVFNDLGSADLIVDFTGGVDRMQLSLSLFAGTGTIGNLMSVGIFKSGNTPVALDANDHILYNIQSGGLYYDPDGNGLDGMIHFTTLTGAPALSYTDIWIVA